MRHLLFSPKLLSNLLYAVFLSLCLSFPASMFGQASHASHHLRLSLSASSSLFSAPSHSSRLALGRTNKLMDKISNTGFSFFRKSDASLPVSRWYLPDYARDNPANWAPLCHLEADIEKQLPIGIWINWEESDRANSTLPPTANVRFRLLSF